MNFRVYQKHLFHQYFWLKNHYFDIVHQNRGSVMVDHNELYRIHKESELDQLGWEELLDSGAVTFIEWPQILEAHLENFYKIRIEMQAEKRLFSLFFFDSNA